MSDASAECPNADTLAAAGDGRLNTGEFAALDHHLDGCDTCREELAALVISEREEDVAPAAVLKRGALVSRYVVLEWLGAGGMGMVFGAYDPELRRPVALKLVRTSASARPGEASARLLREARSVAQLSHPNVIAIHDVGTHGDQVFLAMERVEGASLRAHLAQRKRSWREIRDLFIEAGRGLAAAHAVGLVHGDFKPDNVLVGDDGRVRVSDFGLARAANETPGTEPGTPAWRALGDLTESTIGGTLAYMAPERLRGSVGDARADQFSFCVALYEAAYGVRPFDGDEPTARLSEIAARRLRPASRSSVPLRARRALIAGLSADPARRHASMDALLAQLSPSRVRTHLAWATAAALLAGVAASGGYLLTVRQSQRCAAEAAAVGAVWSEERSTALRAALGTLGKHSDGTYQNMARALDAYASNWRREREALCLAAGELPPPVKADRLGCLDDRLLDLKALLALYQKPDARLLERAVPAVLNLWPLSRCRTQGGRGLASTDPARLSDVANSLAKGKALLGAGRAAEAKAIANAVLEGVNGHRGLEAQAMLLLGLSSSRLAQYPEAAKSLHDAALAAELVGAYDMAARAYLQLANVVGMRGGRDAEAAALWALHAESASERLGSPQDLTAAIALVRANTHFTQGKLVEALEQAKRANELMDGEDSLRRADALSLMGTVNTQLGRTTEAIVLQEQALAVATRLLTPDHVDLSALLSNLSNAQTLAGRLTDALKTSQRALELRYRLSGPEHPLTLWAEANVVTLQYNLKRSPEAADELVRITSALEARLGTEHPKVMTLQAPLARMLFEVGRRKEAETRVNRLLRTVETTKSPSPVLSVDGLILRGELQKDPKSIERALAILEPIGGYPELRSRGQLALGTLLVERGQAPSRAKLLLRSARDAMAGKAYLVAELRQADQLLARLERSGQ